MKNNKKLLSVIIPAWFKEGMDGKYGINETFVIANQCLNRLLKVTDRNKFELIIIDNGSTLDLPEVSEYFSKADKLIKNDINLGFGHAINQGIEIATGEYIIQMNNDILVLDGWLEAMLEVFEHKELYPPVGMSMPNLIKKEYQKDCVNEKGKLDFWKVLELKKENLILRNYGIYEIGAEFGSCWCIKKELADRLIKEDGFFFDPQFLYGMSEDRDIYKRIRLLGYQTFRTNLTRVMHVGNLTIGKLPDHKKYTADNREKLKIKWGIKEDEKAKLRTAKNEFLCQDCLIKDDKVYIKKMKDCYSSEAKRREQTIIINIKPLSHFYCDEEFDYFEGCDLVGYFKNGDSFIFTQGMGFDKEKHKRVLLCLSRPFLENILKNYSHEGLMNRFETFKMIKDTPEK